MKRKIIALFMVISIIVPTMNVLPVRAYNDPADIDNVELMQTKDDDFIINPISDAGDTIENIADDTDIDEQFESNEDTVNGIIDESDSGVSLFASYETITCARRVTIPANMEVRLYSSVTSTSVTSDYYPAESSSWTLYSDSFVNFSDGTASRFHITTGQGASRWFVYYKGMSYTTLHTVQGYKSAHPHYGYCDCGATVSSSTRKNSSCTTCYPPHVYYYTNGGSGAPSSQSGYPITISSTIPTRFPYMFKCWNKSSSGTSTNWYPGESMYNSAGSSTSLYAVWESPTTLNTSSQTTSSVYIGSKGAIGYFKFVPTVTATYAFESTASTDTYGYLYNSSGTQLDYDDDSGDGHNFKLTYAMTAGTTYYFGVKHYSSSSTGTMPVKLRRQYNISYNANNGVGAPYSQTKLYGETLTLSSSRPTREGCTFLGWATSSGATEPEYDPGDSFTLNSDYTLYAVWDVPSYTITFDANNGDNAPSPQTKSYGETITLSEDIPTRSEYKFLGWATSPEATSAEYLPGSSFSLNENCVLYAVWLEYDYTGTPMISVEDDYDKKTVTMSSATDSAVIYYTTDGSEPSAASEIYTEPIIITNEGSITFKAIAVAAGYKDSAVSENEVVLSKLSVISTT